MQPKIEVHIKKKRKIGNERNPMNFVPVFEQLMQSDLVHKQRSKPPSLVYDEVKRELRDAEEALNQIKTKKGNNKRKSTLKNTIDTKKKWISDVKEVSTKNFLAVWAAMFHGYKVELVVNQKGPIRWQGLDVRAACEEYIKLLQTVIAQDIEIKEKTYSWSEITNYKSILNRYYESIKTIVIEDKNEITLERMKTLISGNDLTIEHKCVGHAVYTQIYQDNRQLVISHCNRGNGKRSTYNLLYRININGLDLNLLRAAIERITGLEVQVGNEAHYKNFYKKYDKTLKELGFSFSWGKHVKSQKMGNCVLANLKSLLKERLPEEVYKWCIKEMKSLSTIQHFINPMLESGKNLKNRPFTIETDDDFFHLRQLINYILDKSVEGIVNYHVGKMGKLETLQSVLKALGIYESVINKNNALTRENRTEIKNYIHSKIDLYKKILLSPDMREPGVFYQVLWNEAQKILALSSEELGKKFFFKHLIGKAAINPHIFSDFYDYCYREKRDNSSRLLKLIFSQAIETIPNDLMLKDPENIISYRESLRTIVIKECEKRPYEPELTAVLATTHLTLANPALFVAASVAMKDLSYEGTKYEALKSLFASTLKSSDFLELFVRKKIPQTTTFFRQQKESFDLGAFFKEAAELIVEPIAPPLTEEKLQLHLDKMLNYPIDCSAEKDKIKRFLELFCYKQLLDSKKIDATTLTCWKNINAIVNQCKQISYCVPETLKVADAVLDRYNQLKPLVPESTMKQDELIRMIV